MEESSIGKLVEDKEGFIEALIKKEESFSLDFEKSDLKTIRNHEAEALTIRFTFPDGRTGIASSHPPEPQETFQMAKKQAKVSEEDEDFQGIPKSSSYPEVKQERLNIAKPELIERSQEFVSSVNRVRVRHASTSVHEEKTIFLNSNDVRVREKASLVSASLGLKRGKVTASENKVSRERFDLKKLAKKAEKLCLKSTSPQKARTQKTDMLFDYFALSSLFSNALYPALNADNVYRGKSFLEGKEGEQVFSEKLSIIDNGKLENGLKRRRADSEGYPSKKTTLVENGILKGFLYDFYSARREGKDSTGNCNSLSSRPSIGPSNFIVKPGNRSKQETIRSMDEGLLVTRVKGAHTINPVSGDFSLGVENAFEVKEGELIPVKRAMVSGNVFEMFRKISKIGKVPRQEGNLRSPCILFDDVQVVG